MRILKNSNSDTYKSLEESRSSASANRKLAQECQNNLKNEVEEKEVLQENLELFCQNWSLWSDWSDCSGTCGGKRTRIDKCSNSGDQIEACNEDISCSKSNKYGRF